MSVVILLSYTSDVCDVLCGRELVCNNAVLCTLCVYISIISDIERGVFHCSVTVTVKADDVAALDVFFCNFLTLLGLACRYFTIKAKSIINNIFKATCVSFGETV